MSYNAVIFDLDGTLLDTLDDLAFASNKVLEQQGFPVHPIEQYKYFVGDGLNTLIERITPDWVGQSELDHCISEFRKCYSDCWHRKTRPYKGVRALLADLQESNLKLAILSNKPHEFTLGCVDYFFPQSPFQLVFGQRQEVPRKPDPAGALEIARELGVHPENCIYVGDTKVDMQTGKGAGMLTIGVLWGFRQKAELIESGADSIVESPADLASAILSL